MTAEQRDDRAADQRPGPKPERLKLDPDDWKEALRRALEKVRPPEGWPERQEEDDEGSS